MPYSKFTLSKAVEDFHLTIIEGSRFLPEILPVTPSPLLQDILKETIPWAIAVSSEKARSEGIINPVLLEVKRQLQGQISVFSGEEFNVEPEAELTGYVDFLLVVPRSNYLSKPLRLYWWKPKKKTLTGCRAMPCRNGSA